MPGTTGVARRRGGARELPRRLQLQRRHAGRGLRGEPPRRAAHRAQPLHPAPHHQEQQDQNHRQLHAVLRGAAAPGPLPEPPRQHSDEELRVSAETAGAPPQPQQTIVGLQHDVPRTQLVDSAQFKTQLPRGAHEWGVRHSTEVRGIESGTK